MRCTLPGGHDSGQIIKGTDMKRLFGVFMLIFLSASCGGEKGSPNDAGDDDIGGVTEQTGKMVINPQFDWADDFHEGLALVRIGDNKTGKFGFIDKSGKMVVNPQFDEVVLFREGLARVRIGDEWGFISR